MTMRYAYRTTLQIAAKRGRKCNPRATAHERLRDALPGPRRTWAPDVRSRVTRPLAESYLTQRLFRQIVGRIERLARASDLSQSPGQGARELSSGRRHGDGVFHDMGRSDQTCKQGAAQAPGFGWITVVAGLGRADESWPTGRTARWTPSLGR